MMDHSYPNVRALLRACLDEGVRELFESFDYPIIDAAVMDPLRAVGESIASSIAYTNDSVSGSLTVIGSADILRALFEPTGVVLPAVTDLTDAVGELNNMLIGRIKNKCAAYGFGMDFGTPTTFYGKDLMLTRASPTAIATVFDVSHGRFFVHLDSVVAAGFTPVLVRVEFEDLVSEGAVLLFD